MTNDKLTIKPAKRIVGTITVPADKSISHRAVMFGSIAEGITNVKNFLVGEDCLRTMEAFKAMGVEIKMTPRLCSGFNLSGYSLRIHGKGLYGLEKPKEPIYCGNSGTTIRLLSGILAGQDFQVTLTGDESLSKRPMTRIAAPLRMMGADVRGEHPPLVIRGGKLKAIDYALPVASAQVKSCILLAGLYADGETSVAEPVSSRDHTERMLRLFGVKLKKEGKRISIKGGQQLKAKDLELPADISSAAFFIVAASIVKNSKITIKAVGVNPTRTGVLDIMKAMGAKITVVSQKTDDIEPIADLIIESANLKGATIKGEIIPKAIDELPVIMVAATQAKGTTKILGAKELRVKETDRIKSMVWGLKKMGADIKVKGDDIYIKGPTKLKGARLKSFGDHRTAMSFAVAGLVAAGQTAIEDTDCILTSFPNFKELLSEISQY